MAGKANALPLESVTSTTSTAPAGSDVLGRTFEEANGKVYKFIQANGAIADKTVLQIDASAASEAQAETCVAGQAACGVAVAALADNEYGFMQVEGVASVLTACSGGAATANKLIGCSGSNGKLQPIAVTATGGGAAGLISAVGVALEAKTANQSANVLLKGLR